VCLMSERLEWHNLNLVDWDMFGYRFLASTCRANTMRGPTVEPNVFFLKVLELSRYFPERVNRISNEFCIGNRMFRQRVVHPGSQ